MNIKIAPLALAAAILVVPMARGVRAQTQLSDPGTIRALVVGIDDYLYVPRLRGATSDARDIENTLRNLGVTDLRVMLNASATRGSLLLAFQDLVGRAEKGDTIFLSLSGHGAQEPERVKGSEPDGMDAVFLLAGFDPSTRERNGEKILDKEFNHFIRQVEEKGARVLFVADTCSGGGLAREVDPRAAEMSYRAVKYTPIADDIVPVVDRVDAMRTPADFSSSVFLAAVDKQSKVPEIRVPGIGFRGALSYAVARGLEGAADLDGNGKITAAELFEYSSRVSYQLSDQRQKIVTVSGHDMDPKNTVVITADRGIAVKAPEPQPPTPVLLPPAETKTPVKPVAPPPVQAAPPPAQVTLPPVQVAPVQVAPAQVPPVPPTKPQAPVVTQKPQPPVPVAAPKVPPAPPQATPPVAQKPAPAAVPRLQAEAIGTVRVATLDGQAKHFEGIAAQNKFQVVAPGDNPDLIWDTSKREVLVDADVVARNVDRVDLPGLIERTAAIRWLKARVAKSPQAIVVTPNDRVHRRGARVDIDVDDLGGRALILFNIASDGTVQLLYPVGADPWQRREPKYRLQVQVQAPFGADQIVAVTSGKRMEDLERAMKELDRRRNPLQVSELLSRYATPDALVGSAALFTAQ